jgi:hypothetical protein
VLTSVSYENWWLISGGMQIVQVGFDMCRPGKSMEANLDLASRDGCPYGLSRLENMVSDFAAVKLACMQSITLSVRKAKLTCGLCYRHDTGERPQPCHNPGVLAIGQDIAKERHVLCFSAGLCRSCGCTRAGRGPPRISLARSLHPSIPPVLHQKLASFQLKGFD